MIKWLFILKKLLNIFLFFYVRTYLMNYLLLLFSYIYRLIIVNCDHLIISFTSYWRLLLV